MPVGKLGGRSPCSTSSRAMWAEPSWSPRSCCLSSWRPRRTAPRRHRPAATDDASRHIFRAQCVRQLVRERRGLGLEPRLEVGGGDLEAEYLGSHLALAEVAEQ